MRRSLESFIEKTATSRDANEFLLRYSRVDDEKFLLLIVSLKSEEEFEQLCVQIDDLVALELMPTLWLHPDCMPGKILKSLIEKYKGLGLVWEREGYSDWEGCLREDLKNRSFYKIVWSGGSLRDQEGKIVNQVHLSHDQVNWDARSLEVIKWIRPVLEAHGPSTALQCVEPDQVLPELFTRKGTGTLVSQGYFFEWKNVDEINREKMTELIESGFGRKLKDHYFDKLPKGTRVLLEKEYRGGVVLILAPGFSYLDKVVVKPEFLGRGMGSLLLDELMANLQQPGEESLAWRARADNPYLGRYSQVVHGQAFRRPLECGTVSDESYIYHYLGISPENLREVVRWMSQHCSSFVDD